MGAKNQKRVFSWKWNSKKKTWTLQLTQTSWNNLEGLAFSTKERYWDSPVSPAFTPLTPAFSYLLCDCHLHQFQPFAQCCLNLLCVCLPFTTFFLVLPYSAAACFKTIFSSVLWCSVHQQSSGDGNLKGNTDTVRQPFSSTACKHSLRDLTSCDMR